MSGGASSIRGAGTRETIPWEPHERKRLSKRSSVRGTISSMKIEHIAFNVADGKEAIRWYQETLGMKVVAEIPGAWFIADESGKTVFEIYSKDDAPVPDYSGLSPFSLHIAFTADDINAERSRLAGAGAKPDGEIIDTPRGDKLCFLRDPWGLTIQLVERPAPLF